MTHIKLPTSAVKSWVYGSLRQRNGSVRILKLNLNPLDQIAPAIKREKPAARLIACSPFT